MSDPLFITAGAFASFVLEIVKWLVRRFLLQQPDYDFPPIFYEIGLPLVVFLSEILMGYAGLGPAPEFTPQFLARWFLGVIIALGTYILTIKPFKEYRSSRSE